MKFPDFKKIKRGNVKDILMALVMVYVLLHIFLFSNQRHFMYSPNDTHTSPTAVGISDMMVITVTPSDMNSPIGGWYKQPADPTKPVILFFHGDGGGIADRAAVAKLFIKQGYGVLLAEYRGYSANPGSPSESGFYNDGEAYLDWLKTQEGIPESSIILYGESLGSGIATELASKHLNIGGLILDGGFSSLTDINQRAMPGILVSLVYFDHYNNMAKINRVVSPILFLQGEKDNVVPLALAQKLYNAANQPKTMKVYPEGGHVNLYNYGAMNDVTAFINGLKKG